MDFTAEAIVHISKQGQSLIGGASGTGRNFHLIDRHSFKWCDMFHWVSQRTTVREVQYSEWEELLNSLGQDVGPKNAMFALRPLLAAVGPENSMPSFDCGNTFKMLDGSGITCPSMDQFLLNKYMDRQLEWFVEPC